MCFKNSLKYGSSSDRGRFMKNFRFETICNTILSYEPHRHFLWVHLLKSAVIKYHQLLTKVIRINRKSRFDQLATASSSIPPKGFLCDDRLVKNLFWWFKIMSSIEGDKKVLVGTIYRDHLKLHPLRSCWQNHLYYITDLGFGNTTQRA